MVKQTLLRYMDDEMKSLSETTLTADALKSVRERYLIEGLTHPVITDFQSIICNYYRNYGRKLLWRKTSDPYHILISEIMLQQTQVQRVVLKYPLFIQRFPDFSSLARGSLEDILRVWEGLGYNRRAIAVKKIAQRVTDEFNGILPSDPSILTTFPGIGPATARSIVAFAFNKPVVFLETNIRTVFISAFFPEDGRIHDREVLPFVEQTLPKRNVRSWYSALMDYGAMLRKEGGKIRRRSVTYHPPTRFEGSDRQARGRILKVLLRKRDTHTADLQRATGLSDKRLNDILHTLQKEGFIDVQDCIINIIGGNHLT